MSKRRAGNLFSRRRRYAASGSGGGLLLRLLRFAPNTANRGDAVGTGDAGAGQVGKADAAERVDGDGQVGGEGGEVAPA